MGIYEDMYRKSDEQRRLAEEHQRIEVWNREVAIIKEVIGEILKRAKVQHPEKCDWIKNTLVDTTGEYCVSWEVYSETYGSKHVNLLPDGRLILLGTGHDCIIELVYIDKSSNRRPKGFHQLVSHMTTLRERLVSKAQSDFGCEGFYQRYNKR